MIIETSQQVNGAFCIALNLYRVLLVSNALEILELWANAQRDGRPAEYRWRPLFNAAVWLTPTTRVPCSNAAKMRNPLKLPGVPQTNETISAASGPKFTILWGHVEEILLLNKFFFRLSMCLSCEDIARQSCGMVHAQMAIFGDCFGSCICSEPRAAPFRPAF